MDKEEILKKIILENSNLFSNSKNIEKIDAGFTNDIYLYEDIIIKICKNKLNEKNFNTEIDFYINNKDYKYIPRLYAYHKAYNMNDVSYLIVERIKGKSLYYKWHTFTDDFRKNIIYEISNIMKTFHLINGEPYDWNVFITEKIRKNLNNCYNKKIIDKSTYEKGISILDKSFKYLNSFEFVLVHSDIHFDNIIFTNDNELKIIDFETSLYAPIDYELDIFLRMCNKPFKYASMETEPLIKNEDYMEIESWLREFYPKLFSNKNHDIRMKFYNLKMNLSLLNEFKEDKELKKEIINEIEELTMFLKK